MCLRKEQTKKMKKFEFKKLSSVKRVAKVDLAHLDRQLSDIPDQNSVQQSSSPTCVSTFNTINNDKCISVKPALLAKNNSSNRIESFFSKKPSNKNNSQSQENGKVFFAVITILNRYL